ncbi:glycoside hydrolase family 6 protein [Kitasatospora sp. NBC_01287]|uniref:glycoside hydrolase family 6 protein n=1 Tax=Kitasatospora sp. NBC_01287 TaxID=2903573 RepID=UPI002254E15D|nr:glycoside hydrolase family 6 protein [Kitasatospora sp. NBC_01287]MCX4744173.1 glycoside hydrolase family 6 protein [Kitasatospora sp. NBC_01287]
MPHPLFRRLRTAAAAIALGAAALTPVVGAPSAQAATTTTTVTTSAAAHVANPFVGATGYLNPDYVAEVDAQAAADGGALGAAETQVAANPTAVWMDHIGAIAGDSTHLGLRAQLDHALTQAAAGSSPVVFEVVVYDLPGRDCAALASNGELPATSAGLATYESQYVDPVAAILSDPRYAALRIAAVIEPDSLPNAVTNQSKPACATATPLYESGIEYALNKLHPITNVYDYLDIGHAGWLGWPSNMNPAGQEYAKVARATTAGFASIDGFISDTANTTPTTEPFLGNPDLQVGGNPLKSADFYQYNPEFDEYGYDTAMYSTMVANGFPSTVGFLIDTSRNGWGGPSRPTALNAAPTTVNGYVTANKVDQRPFRGDWCNVDGAGIGARPQALPYGSGSPIIAFVWVKPPGESDGDYPTATHSHGDPHCDPDGTQSDGNGGTYPTDAIPGYDIPAGQWFGAQFQQLVRYAYPSFTTGTGGDTTPPSVPTGLSVTGSTASGVSLAWSAATDNVGVAGYHVYRGGTEVGSTSGTSYTDTGLSAATDYQYSVSAYDAAGNASALSAAVTATTASGGGSGGGCTATYTVASDWGSGFNANVTVADTGTAATKSWTVSWTWGGAQRISNSWNATVTQSGSAVSAASLGYNGAIAVGGSTSFGFQGSYTGSNTAPVLSCAAS